jgi:predicted MFS family arabinose efflux permease
VGAAVLALIGLFNIAGSLAAGWLGARYPKPRVLAAIYLGRGIAIVALVLLPLSPATAYAFAIAMGLLWLSTVPLTNGTVATIFGTGNLSMLAGLVFLAHQIGSFAGGWLGGAIHDRSGNYDIAWGVALGLSLLAMLANLPIRERPAGQGASA